MGSKTRLCSYCTKRANNGVNLVTSRKINTRLARPIRSDRTNSKQETCLETSGGHNEVTHYGNGATHKKNQAALDKNLKPLTICFHRPVSN